VSNRDIGFVQPGQDADYHRHLQFHPLRPPARPVAHALAGRGHARFAISFRTFQVCPKDLPSTPQVPQSYEGSNHLTTNPAIMALASNPKAHASIVLATALLRAVADLLYVIMPKGPQGQKRPAVVIGKVVKVMPIATREKTETATAEEGSNQAAEALGLSTWPAEIGTPGDAASRSCQNCPGPRRRRRVRNRIAAVQSAAGYWRRGAGTATAHIGLYCRGGPSGLLMSYGQDFPDYVRRAAACVDKS
jgi:hypothetical protein